MITYETSQEAQLTLSVLKRSDPDISAIITHIPWTAVYSFGSNSPFDSQTGDNKWHRIDYEGSLFILERTSQPKYQFIILNRKNANNFVQTIQSDFQLAKSPKSSDTSENKDDPSAKLVIYKAGQKILGLWFYREQDKNQFIQSIKTLISQIKSQSKPQHSSSKSFSENVISDPSISQPGRSIQYGLPSSTQSSTQTQIARQTMLGMSSLPSSTGQPVSHVHHPNHVPVQGPVQVNPHHVITHPTPPPSAYPPHMAPQPSQPLANQSQITPQHGYSSTVTPHHPGYPPQQSQVSQSQVPIWTKEDLKRNLLLLCENDQFIDLIYQQFVNRLKQAGY